MEYPLDVPRLPSPQKYKNYISISTWTKNGYRQTRSSIATQLSFWDLFYKFFYKFYKLLNFFRLSNAEGLKSKFKYNRILEKPYAM